MKKGIIKLIIISLLIMTLPFVYSYPARDKEAAMAADEFVKSHGIFYNRFSILKEVRLFRTTYSVDENEISFLYVALWKMDDKIIKAVFIVTLSRQDLSLVSLNILKDEQGSYNNLQVL